MWPLVSTLLLGSWCFGSAQLLFKNIKSVNYNNCNETVTIPCYMTNIGSNDSREFFVKWNFKGKSVLVFNGPNQEYITGSGFSSAKINVLELIKGDASLHMDKGDAQLGNYTCEVTELSREGEITVELGFYSVSWFPSNEYTLIVAVPVVAINLF